MVFRMLECSEQRSEQKKSVFPIRFGSISSVFNWLAIDSQANGRNEREIK